MIIPSVAVLHHAGKCKHETEGEDIIAFASTA